jgi:hypothetical protein
MLPVAYRPRVCFGDIDGYTYEEALAGKTFEKTLYIPKVIMLVIYLK